MIMACNISLEIGKIHTPDLIHDSKANEHEGIPFIVIREATRQEYEDYCRLMDSPTPANKLDYPYYYEVHTD